MVANQSGVVLTPFNSFLQLVAFLLPLGRGEEWVAQRSELLKRGAGCDIIFIQGFQWRGPTGNENQLLLVARANRTKDQWKGTGHFVSIISVLFSSQIQGYRELSFIGMTATQSSLLFWRLGTRKVLTANVTHPQLRRLKQTAIIFYMYLRSR